MNYHNFILLYLALVKTLAKLTGGSYTLFQNGIAMIVPSSGSIGDNGALTLTTALPTTFVNCYMYFPANAIEAGSAAGLYYVQMSSTTAGTIFNNTYTSGRPTIPASPTAFVTTGPGAYTQTTATDLTISSFALPGGAMGAHGVLWVDQLASQPGNGNVKIPKIKIGATTVFGPNYTTQTLITVPYILRNRGVQNRNVDNQTTGLVNSTTLAAGYRTIDTSTDLTVLYTANLANAADYFILEGLDAQIKPA